MTTSIKEFYDDDDMYTWPGPLTFNLGNLFSNSHLQDEYLWHISL